MKTWDQKILNEHFICFGCAVNTSLSFSRLPSILFLLTLAHPSLFYWLFIGAVHKLPANPCTDMTGKCVTLTININNETDWKWLPSLSYFILHFHNPLRPLISSLHRKSKHKPRCIKVPVSEKTLTVNSMFKQTGWAGTLLLLLLWAGPPQNISVLLLHSNVFS